jgi:hypothetical protein
MAVHHVNVDVRGAGAFDRRNLFAQSPEIRR